ncbi:MAG TPA: acyltransferase [Rhodobacteraceae bacterium]|nr:acyltransferase [Paracoccaceae bacterium]
MITYRSDIDGLRSVAVVPVVLNHAGLPWLSGGFIGVDVFFVISGFLITSIIAPECAAGQFSLLRFYERRARRILPALFFVVAVSFFAATVMLLPDAFVGFAGSVLATLGFVSNIWFWSTSTGYFAPAADLLPLLHTWSLAVEEQFYIFYPLLLALLLRWGRQTAILGIAALSLLSLGLAVWATPRMPAASFYLLPTRAWELGFGALLALGVGPRRMHRGARETLSVIALAAILLPVFLYSADTAFPGLAALPPVLGSALLILIGATGSSAVHRTLGSRAFVAVGLISYSLYLWHWPVLAFLRVYSAGPDLPATLAIAAVCLSTLMAYLSWRYIERPFRIRPGTGRATGKATGKPRGYSQGAIARFSLGGAVAIGVVAGLVLVGNGWPSRVQEDVLAVARTAQPTRFRQNCMRQYAPEDICRFGAPSNPGDPVDLVLIGDSHAAAVADAFDLAAREAGLSGVFFGNVSCAPLVGVVTGTIDQRENCRQLMQAAVAFTENTPGLRYVALVARWPVVVERDLLPGERGKPFPIRLDTDVFPDAPVGTTNAPAVTAALPRTLEAFAAPGVEFLLLGPIPEIGWNVPDHLIAHLRWGNPMPADPDISSVLVRQSRAIDILEAASAARPDTTYIPVADELCKPDCPTHEGGTAFYWDDDHLTPVGAERLIAPLLRPHLAGD